MRITKKICKDSKIFNDWDYAQGHPYLYYSASERWRLSGWRVFQEGMKFSDHWNDYGAMVFTNFGRADKQAKFEEAIDWMKQKFGYTEIVKTPMGSWMDKSFVDKRNEKIEQSYKSLKIGA